VIAVEVDDSPSQTGTERRSLRFRWNCYLDAADPDLVKGETHNETVFLLIPNRSAAVDHAAEQPNTPLSRCV